VLCFAQEEPGDQDKKEWIHIVLTAAGHKINSITDVMLNDEPIGNYGGYYELATYPQGRTTADPFLQQKCPDWTSTMIGKGFAWARISLKFNQELFPSGLPNITMLKHGFQVEDPRVAGLVDWSDNPALCILHYLRLKGWEDEYLIIDSFIEAANICDEMVLRPDGSGSDRRYAIGCEFDDSDTPASVLDKMLATCGGEWIRVGGRIGLRVAAYYGPAFFDITEDEIIDGIEIQPEQDRSDSFNIVRGTYVAPDQNYTEVDYPEVRVQEWVTEDEEEIVMDFDLDYVQNPWQAQRLADIALKRSRLGMTMKLPCNLRGFQAVPGTMINLSLPQIGFNKAEFMVVDWEFSIDNGVVLVVRRDLPSFYDDAVGKPVVTPPLIDLPTGGISAPTNPVFSAKAVGDVVQGVVSWTNTAFNLAHTNVIVKDSGGFIVGTYQVPFPSNEQTLSGLVDGTYTVELQSVAVNTAKSQVVILQVTIAAPQKPDSVNVKRSNWAVSLIPAYDLTSVPFGTLFEFRYLADNASYISGQPTYNEGDIDKSEEIDVASSLSHSGLIPDRWQHYWVRAVNSYGKSDYIYVRTGTTKEQDLVTTVVERLQAIEIESANWDDEAGTGYKLFSPASAPYTMPDGTVLQNPDGLIVANNMVAKGHITAESMTFVENDIELDDLSMLQLSGGGYKYDHKQGWGVTSGGFAEFNGGLTVNSATIVGATIIGAEIYSGSIYYQIDYNTDGRPDDVRYLNYPDVPLSARSSFTSSGSFSLRYTNNTRDDTSFTFPVTSVLERRGEPNASRFRWGKVRQGAMSFVQTGGQAHRVGELFFRLQLIAPDGSVSAQTSERRYDTVYSVNDARDVNIDMSIAGLTFRFSFRDKGISGPSTNNIEWYKCQNLQSTQFGELDDQTKNGTLRVLIGMDSSKGTIFYFSANTDVDNDNFPG
jgi:hypothetical protein